jgi:hypothetical protein
MKPILGIVALVGFFGRCEPYVIAHEQQAGHDWRYAAGSTGTQPTAAGQGGSTVSVSAHESSTASADSCAGPPGLYVDGSCTRLQDDIRSYRPQYELWSDDATKQRYIYLPPDTQIDTSNPDRWSFPLGTRIYKTFSLDGKRIETRLLEKTAAPASIDSWTMTAYAWSEDQHSVAPADPAGVNNALGTTHDIPSAAQCKTCHTMTGLDAVNGFGAIQLNHRDRGVTLRELVDEGRLVNVAGMTANVTLETARVPGDDQARAALGYLHANCGHCHGGPNPRAAFTLWSIVGAATVADAPAFKSGACVCLTRWGGRKNAASEPYTLRIASGHAAQSAVIGRMNVRAMGEQMPPLGSELVDDAAVAAVSAWIDGLDPAPCANIPACPPPMPASMSATQSAGGARAPAAAAPSAAAAAPPSAH